MARKKVTPPPSTAVVTDSTKFQNTENNQSSHRPHSPTEDMMENLKTLNGLLVKETMDTREQLGQLKCQIDDVSLESSVLFDIDRAVCHLVVGAALKEERQKLVGLDRRLETFVAETEECKLEAWEEIRRVKVEVESLMKEKKENYTCLIDAKSEVARLTKEKGEVEKALAVVVGEKDARGRDCDVLRSELGILKEKVLLLENAISRSNLDLKDEKRESARKVDLLVTENKVLVENLKKELNIVVGEKDKLETLAAKLSEKLKSSEESCRVFGDENKKLLSGVSELKDEIAWCRKESDNLKKEVDNSQKHVLELKQGIETSESLLEAEKRENKRKMEMLVVENNLVITNLKENSESQFVAEKRENERKKEMLVAEHNLVIANLKEEVSILASEKVKLESSEAQLVAEKRENERKMEVLVAEHNLVVTNLKEEVSKLLVSEKVKLESSETQLVAEKRENERKMEMLVAEHNLVVTNLKEEVSKLFSEKVKLESSEAQLVAEKRENERKMEMLVAEHNLIIANLKEEVSKLVSEKVKLESSEAQLVAEKKENERKMAMLVMENGLVISNLKEELSGLAIQKVEFEKKIAELSEKLQCFEESCELLEKEKKRLLSTVSELKDEIDFLKGEETAKSSKNSELREMNDKLHGELDAKTQEVMLREKEFKLHVEDMSRQMDDLQRRLEGAVVEKNQDIDNLVEEVEQLKSEVSLLRKLCNVQAEDIKQLQGEKSDLQTTVEQQIEKEKDMELQVVALQNYKATADEELDHLKTASEKFAEEKKTLENKLLCLIEEKKVACSVLASTKHDLEDSKEEARAAAELSELTLAALKGMSEELKVGGHNNLASGLGENQAKSDLLAGGERIRPFLVELESMKKFFLNRKKEMESMKQELLVLQESIAGAKKRGLWAWVSSATTIVAAVAYAVKNR